MDDLNNKPLTQIEKLKRTLFFKNKNKNKKKEVINNLKPKKYLVDSDWKKEEVEPVKNQPDDPRLDWQGKGDMKKESKSPKKKMTFFGKLVIFSVLFFIGSFFVALYVFYGGVNIISTENVDISISGPSSIGGGEELSFQITVQNNNSVDLELADLIVEYPNGTLLADDRNTKLTLVRKTLNTVPAGGSSTHIFKSVLFGNEGDLKDIIITIEYRAKGSNAIFFKERKYEVLIDSSPIVFVVDIPEKITAGQEFEMDIEIYSNSNKVIEDFLFEADYPFGFIFKDSNIRPSYRDNIWSFGDISPNSKNILKIQGVLEGQNEEERIFRFYGGSEDKEDDNVIKAKLVSIIEPILIRKSLIGVDLVLNGDYSSEYITSSDKDIRVDVLWSNNLITKLVDAELVVNLKGNTLDKRTISSDEGYYKSLDNSITWNKKSSPQLAVLNPGDSGNLSFSFSIFPLSYISNSGVKNPEIELELVVKANQLSELDSSVEKIETKLVKTIKLNTDLLLTGQTLYSVGSFENTGPIPPKVDNETTYTIVLTATNTSNSISKAKVVATLPAYVKWMDRISPSFENIKFNQVGGEIVWDIGDLPAGAGILTAMKEVSFQVSFLPSLSQVGSEPVLIDNLYIEGVDDFTGKYIKYPIKAITTSFETDPVYGLRDEDVVE
ncbi:MAG: hypothetical protein KAS02_00115 [Candidatus Pacebacteria bacterium]|nr:hypothetical protein [Candidatus Paceibacterota bacterium]